MSSTLEELKYRGLIEQTSDEKEVDDLLKQKVPVYCGFDPSAGSLHLGNYVMISMLMRLQKVGHKIIAIVGGATGMIGDPSGKSSERNLLTREVAEQNTLSIKSQLEKYIDLSDPNKGELLSNLEWIDKLSTIDFLRDYGKYFPINYMLAKEIVKSRLESGISFTEFSYQILQAIDFHYLYNHKGVKLQIGGNDQWGNLTSGLELIRKMDNKEDAACFTVPLILRSDGKKFGKSEQGALFLDPALTSPYTLYQYFINVTDEDAIRFLKIFSFLSKEEIEKISEEHFASLGQRLAQKKLAYEVTKDIHGVEAADKAVSMSNALFSGEVSSLDQAEIEELFGQFKVSLNGSYLLEDLLITLGAATSKREARTFISGNSVLVNGVKVNDLATSFSKDDALFNKYLVVRRGKKNYYLGEF